MQTKTVQIADCANPLKLESGKTLSPVTLAYETYGALNESRSNAVLICHALSGDAHVAGYSTPEDRKPGWWDDMVGPGRAFDTDRYFIVCSNVIGGCKGSTGPLSENPESDTKDPYGLAFPVITIRDMVDAQKRLVDTLGIDRLLCVVGGSMGGMQALQWAVSYPDRVRTVIPIATTARLSALSIAFNEVGRQAIMTDPNWSGGRYYELAVPAHGLAIARMIGHITYLSEQAMHRKFGRRLQDKGELGFGFVTDFQVESYLRHQGDSFVKRFDANSYLYLTKAMDYFDLSQPDGSLRRAFENVTARFLVISFSSDWLYPTYQSREIVSALRRNNVEVSNVEITTDHGHDAFLLEPETLTQLIGDFLAHA